jgi:hypothetical protein
LSALDKVGASYLDTDSFEPRLLVERIEPVFRKDEIDFEVARPLCTEGASCVPPVCVPYEVEVAG